MKKLIYLGLVTAIATGLALSGCKKNKDEDTTNDDGTEQSEMSTDESDYNNEMEASLNDANTAVSTTGFGKTSPIFGASVNDSTYIGQKKIVITYNGTTSDGRRNRTGTLSVQLVSGSKWSDAGAQVRLDANITITRISNGRSVNISGTHYITNVSGGHAFVDASVVHRARGTSLVTFDNGQTRSWMIARKRTFTVTAGVLGLTLEGDTTVDGKSNVVVWGTNRRGNSFYTRISQPVVFKSTCLSAPLAGIKIHSIGARDITVTFGVDATGAIYTGSSCPYGFKVQWIGLAGNARTAVISY